MKPKTSKILKRVFEFAFFIAVMLLSFYTIFKGQDLAKIWTEIKTMSVPYLLLSIFMSLSYVCLEGVMICYLLHSIDKKSKILNCLKYSFVGFFYSAITPSASGGQPMQLYYMAKDGHQFNKSFVVLMVVATMNKIVLVLVGLFLLIFKRPELMNFLNMTGSMLNIKFGTWFYIGLFIDFCWVLILVALMCFSDKIRKFCIWIVHLIFKRHPAKLQKSEISVNDFFSGYRDSIAFITKNTKKIFVTTVLSIIQRLCPILITLFVYRGLGIKAVPATDILMLQASIYVTVDMLPIPGAQGITEIMYLNIFQSLIGQTKIMSSMYVTRGVNFYLLLVIAAITSIACYFYYSHFRKANSKIEEAKPEAEISSETEENPVTE